MYFPGGFDLVSFAVLTAGSTAAWTFVYGFAVRYGIDHPRLTGRRLTAVAAAGGITALPLAAVAAVLSTALGAVSGVAVPVWLSLWAAAGPLGLLLTLAYHERLGGRAAPAK